MLFADVVGFTSLSEARDPERVKYVLDRCFEGLARDVTSHGGRVDKIVGDELMAVFGSPITHEDDAERAVRAALQMQRTLAEHAAESGAQVDIRIGINTGEVVVGSLRAGGDVTALGDVVNTASRLEKSGLPGQVLVGDSTYEATKEIISYEHIGSLTLRGRDEPVEAWRAMEALGPPGSRPGRRPKTPLVGRKAELGMLWHAMGTAVEHKRPHLVLIVGEAGMGKTLLVEEAVEIAKAQHGALVLQGRCLPYGEANQWWPVAEALRQASGIEDDDPAEVAADKCRSSIAALLGAEDEGVEAGRVADGLLYLMGYEGSLHDVDPSRARDEAVRSIQVALAANARERPLVIVLSEIHWADQVVLDLVDTMFERLRNLPIVLLATARPDLEERWSPRPGRHNLIVVNLDALGRNDARELAKKLLEDQASPHMVDLIVERSGGNPLFIHELIRLLGETEGAHDQASLEAAELPATLRGLVAARIDSLSGPERLALEDAAVVGRNGPVEALEELARARSEANPLERLEELAQKDLLSIDDGEFEFRSDLVRDVAYETLTKAERARRHAFVGDWFGTHAKRTEREDEYLERIAHHYAIAAELAGEIGAVDGVPEQLRTRALEWLERAAVRADERETTATTTSVHLLEHALNLAGAEDGARRASFLLRRARGLSGQRDMERAHADVAAAIQIGEAMSDKALCARALTVRGEIEQREGDLAASAATLEGAVKLWKETGDQRGEAEALRLWGYTSVHRGELIEAEQAISDALNLSRKLGDRRGEAWALQNLAWASFSAGDNDLAEERLTASARLFEDIGDFGGRSWAIGLLAYVWYFKGRLEDAAAIAEQSVGFSRELGDRWAHGMMLNLLAQTRLWQGRTRDALVHATEAHRVFVDIDDKMGLAQSSTALAWAQMFLGRTEEAIKTVEPNIESAGEIFGTGWAAFLNIATMNSLRGQPEEALSMLDRAGASSTGFLGDQFSLASRALALFVGGHFEEAYEAASKSWSIPEDPGPRANAGCILALCASAAGHPEESLEVGDEVGRLGGTYVDQVRAHIGRALAYARMNRAGEAEVAATSARTHADASEDLVHSALAELTEAIVYEAVGRAEPEAVDHARTRLNDLGVNPDPWERSLRAAAGD